MFLVLDIVQGDVRARGRERRGYRQPHSARRAGDNGRPPGYAQEVRMASRHSAASEGLYTASFLSARMSLTVRIVSLSITSTYADHSHRPARTARYVLFMAVLSSLGAPAEMFDSQQVVRTGGSTSSLRPYSVSSTATACSWPIPPARWSMTGSIISRSEGIPAAFAFSISDSIISSRSSASAGVPFLSA